MDIDHSAHPVRVRGDLLMLVIAAPGCFPILANRQPFRLRRIERFKRALSEFALNNWNDWNGAPVLSAAERSRRIAVERLELSACWRLPPGTIGTVPSRLQTRE